MSNSKDAIKGVEMSLSDMIAGMIQATIDADQAVTDDYLEAFTKYAFDEPANGRGNARLKMVDFEMTDSEGNRQVVSIPKLSLLPLPVLHVSEAVFDIDADMHLKETKGSKGVVNTNRLEALRKISNSLYVSIRNPKVTQQTSTEESSQSINMKVHIKLEPAQLPNGMRGLLQETDTNIQVTRTEE
jgi:hypothetical protein